MKEILKCPVCNNVLTKEEKSFKCVNNHSYDLGKRGHVNLLLANQTHSDLSGDNKEMILARENFLKTGKYDCLRNTLFNIINESFEDEIILGDMACGEGYYTKYIHDNLSKNHIVSTYGVDISKNGIIECSKKVDRNKDKNIQFVIGNLMYLPFLDASFDCLINCFAKLDEKEFVRVLRKGGMFIRVLPGKNHLYEMKEVLYDKVILNEEKDENIDGLSFVKKIEVNDVIELNNDDINNLFKMTPYYYKTSKEASLRLESMDFLKTKISFSILIYKKD